MRIQTRTRSYFDPILIDSSKNFMLVIILWVTVLIRTIECWHPYGVLTEDVRCRTRRWIKVCIYVIRQIGPTG